MITLQTLKKSSKFQTGVVDELHLHLFRFGFVRIWYNKNNQWSFTSDRHISWNLLEDFVEI